MPRTPRIRFVDFETRSVQLIAACTLGLAGLASLPQTGNALRSAGPSSTSSPSTATAGPQARLAQALRVPLRRPPD